MTGAGRPLRFMIVVIGGWIGLRTVQLWPVPPLPPVLASFAAAPARATPVQPTGDRLESVAVAGNDRGTQTSVHDGASGSPERAVPALNQGVAMPAPSAAVGLDQPEMALESIVGFAAGIVLPATPPPAQRAASMSRLAGSGWLIARSGGGASAPFAPQLGGSQAGVRLTYALGDARRVALAARLSSALSSRQREAAIGLDWQPSALPLHIVAEQRIGIENARGGPAIGLIGGLPPTPLAAGFALDGYAQAGAIARAGVEGYVDGAVRLTRPVAAAGPARIDIGVGAWGGAQRGASRLDVGPSASLALPKAGLNVRLSIEWRQRIAGTARPGSGPALSLGTDF